MSMDIQPMRYDPDRQVYRDCRFCEGRGCIACPGEADKDYNREFPGGPKPIATFKIDELAEIGKLKSVLGPKAIMAAKKEGLRRARQAVERNPGVIAGIAVPKEQAIQLLGTSMAGDVIHENLVKSQKRKKASKGRKVRSARKSSER